MFEAAAITTANCTWLGICWPAYRRFVSSLSVPKEAQTRVLLRTLRANSGSHYGRKYAFSRIESPADFQDAVPTVSYGDVEPCIQRIMRGESQVLTTEPVVMLEKTSGSTSAAKYIPYTASLRREFQQAVHAWIFDLYWRRPALLSGSSYWCISPLTRGPEQTEGAIPIGFESDTEYLSQSEQWLLRRILAVPGLVSRIPNLENCLYVTLRFLLQSESLKFVSIWNPSYLTLLMNHVRRHLDRLVADLESGGLSPPFALNSNLSKQLLPLLRRSPRRARQIRGLARSGALIGQTLWPELKLISCWTDAAAALAVTPLRQEFPAVEIQGKGLLATEGVVSIPLTHQQGAALAVNSHFYEFMCDPKQRPKLAHELELAGEYTVLLTTSGGLYRYNLEDRVRVVGLVGKTPLLQFVGRESGIGDLCGEKLNPAFVAEVLARLRAQDVWSGRFALLAPYRDNPLRYMLFVEKFSDSEVLATRLDGALRANPHYDYCRRLGQLGEAYVFRVRSDGTADYLRRMESDGQRVGGIKPTPLSLLFDWERWFEGQVVSTQRKQRLWNCGT